MTEHRTDLKNPWSVKKSKPRNYELGKYDGNDDPDEIAFIAEIQTDFRENLDALVCCLIIGGMVFFFRKKIVNKRLLRNS